MSSQNVIQLCADADDGDHLLAAAAFKMIDEGADMEAAVSTFISYWDMFTKARIEALQRMRKQ